MKIIIASIFTYGSAVAIGFAQGWEVGLLLVLMAVGHNMDKH